MSSRYQWNWALGGQMKARYTQYNKRCDCQWYNWYANTCVGIEWRWIICGRSSFSEQREGERDSHATNCRRNWIIAEVVRIVSARSEMKERSLLMELYVNRLSKGFWFDGNIRGTCNKSGFTTWNRHERKKQPRDRRAEREKSKNV